VRRFISGLAGLVLAVCMTVGTGHSSAQVPDRAAAPAFKLIDAPRQPEPTSLRREVVPAAARLEAPPKAVPLATATAPALTLRKLGPASVSVGQPFTYEIVIRNVGTAPATRVIVEDILPFEMALLEADPRPDIQGRRLGWGLGTLDPGVERRFKVEAKLVQGVKELPPATVSFSVPCALPVGADVMRQCDTSTGTMSPNAPPTPGPLTLKVTGPETVVLGQPAKLEIEMTNTGSVPLDEIVLRNLLPAGLKHPQGNDIEADLPPLGPHETRKITLSTTAVQAGRQIDQVTVKATETMVKGADHWKVEAKGSAVIEVQEPGDLAVRTTVPQVPAIALHIRNKDTVIEVGAETVFEIQVLNQGTSPSTNVQVIAVLPEGMQLRRADGPSPFGLAGRQVSFEPMMTRLDPGKEALYRIRAICQRVGDWRFKVQLTSDQLRLPVCKEECMRIYDGR
jgi:uncharacterized repeat protein (TIGR01451 family)